MKSDSIEKMFQLVKVVMDLAPAIGFAYVIVEYPGYISYAAIISLFILGLLALLLFHRQWLGLEDWGQCIGILGIVCILAATGGLAYKAYRAYWGPVIILVAQFTGTEAYNARLTDQIWSSLSTVLKEKPHIKLIVPDRPLSGPAEAAVRKEAKKRDANIAIWGTRWVEAPLEKLDIHFDVLHPGYGMDELKSERIQVEPRIVSTERVLSKMNHFRIEVDVANDLTYLALITLGVARRAKADFDGAIAAFTGAIENINRQRQVLQLDESIIKSSSYELVLFQRATTYLLKRDHDSAFSDFVAISDKNKDFGAFTFAVGAMAALEDQDYRAVIVYASRVIEAISDDYLGYYLTGLGILKLSHEIDPLEEKIKLLYAGVGLLMKAMDLVSSDAGLDDMRRTIAKDIAGPHVMFGFLHRQAGQVEASEEMFQKAREFARTSADRQTLKKVDSLIQKARERLKNPKATEDLKSPGK